MGWGEPHTPPGNRPDPTIVVREGDPIHPIPAQRLDPPGVEVTRVGRWTYRLIIVDDLCEYGPGSFGVVFGWRVMGKERAARKARRELDRYLRQKERNAEVTTLR